MKKMLEAVKANKGAIVKSALVGLGVVGLAVGYAMLKPTDDEVEQWDLEEAEMAENEESEETE